jgi:nicotinamide-nucleotide amidase
MKAAILAVGSELLATDRLDTNSLRLTAVLQRFGVELIAKSVIGDDEAAIARELNRRLEEVELVIVSGGLGPTADDVTRAATAQALGRGLRLEESLVDHMRQLFAGFGRTMPEVNRRQAEVIDGATVLHNPAGTAPGQRLEAGGATIFLLPGVPRELDVLVAEHLEPWRLERCGDQHGYERGVLKVACLPESVVEERIAPAYALFGRENISVLASPGDIKIYFGAAGTADERRERLATMRAELARLAGAAVYTDREDGTLEQVVVEQMLAHGKTVATAESCTGGLVAERISSVAGCSPMFKGGVVAYSYELKTLLLDVPAEMLTQHGAVSETVVNAMASEARRRYDADFSIAISGIAGPGGGLPEKPVGTVHLTLAGPGDDDIDHRCVRFPGDRERVRRMTSQLALEMLRRRLAGLPAA